MSSKSQATVLNIPPHLYLLREAFSECHDSQISLSCKMPTPNSLLGPPLTTCPMPHSPAQGQALNLGQSASIKLTLFSLLYRVRGSFREQVHCTGLRPGGRCSPSPVSPLHSAGSCPCWLGLPPNLLGLAGRGRTRRVSSHCRSTGRARAPLAEAAARLPHRRLPPPCPLSVGLCQAGGVGNWVLFPE